MANNCCFNYSIYRSPKKYFLSCDMMILMMVQLVQHKTIDSVLARGEKLDSLVEKSSDLSAASQVLIYSHG